MGDEERAKNRQVDMQKVEIPFSNLSSTKNLSSKSLAHPNVLSFSFSESFIPRDKQGGAAVLREGHDIVTRGTCVSASLNVNNLGKAAELHLAFLLSSVAGAVPNLSLQII
jgi:hypothetical protein